MNETAEPAADDSAARRTRSLRVGATLAGLPLALALVLPWHRRDESFGVLELAERGDRWGFVLVPACGLLFVAAGLAPRLSHNVRAGLASFVLGLSLFSSPLTLRTFRELGSLSVFGVYFFFAAICIGPTLEVAMHQRPRSRGLTALATLGWMVLPLVLLVPVGPRAEFDQTMLGAVFEGLARGRGEVLVLLMVLAMPLAVAWTGWFQTLRRLGKDRDEAASRRFRTSWLAYLQLVTPLLVLLGVASLASMVDEPSYVTNVHNVFAMAWGALFGTAVGVGHALAALAHPEGFFARPLVRRLGAVAAVVAALVALSPLVLPERRDDGIAELEWQMAEAIAAALRGESVDPRYLGGYAEFDLRSAASVLADRLPDTSGLTPVLFSMRVGVGRQRAELVTFPDGRLRWAALDPHWGGGIDRITLERAAPELVDAIDRTGEGAVSVACLPGLAADDLEGMPAGVREHLSGPAQELCDGDSVTGYGGSMRTFGGRGDLRSGYVDRYLIVVRAGSGELIALEGALRPDTGLLWIGAPRLGAPIDAGTD